TRDGSRRGRAGAVGDLTAPGVIADGGSASRERGGGAGVCGPAGGVGAEGAELSYRLGLCRPRAGELPRLPLHSDSVPHPPTPVAIQFARRLRRFHWPASLSPPAA